MVGGGLWGRGPYRVYGGFMGLGVLIGLGGVSMGWGLWGPHTTPQILSPIGDECHGRSCYGAGGPYRVGGPYGVLWGWRSL